jgi:hypothetical protein
LLLFSNDLLDPQLTAIYLKQNNAGSTKPNPDETAEDFPLEITVDDLPVQAVLFEAFMINR